MTTIDGVRRKPQQGHVTFEVQGAGQISTSPTMGYSTGTAKGVAFDCGWSRFGFSGGVMDRTEMVRLRDHLTTLLGDK